MFIKIFKKRKLQIKRKKTNKKIEWNEASEITKLVKNIVNKLNLNWVETNQITCYSSTGSKTRAYARIWGLSKVWQMALSHKPHYIIEVISEKFDKLTDKQKNEVLIHELMHIPRNFSGALMPHIRKRGKRNFHDKVHKYVNQLNKV